MGIKKGKVMQYETPIKGNCFMTAFTFMNANRGNPNLRLVHGLPMYNGTEPNKVGKRMGHAWVEEINPKTGHSIVAFDGNIPKIIGLPTPLYYIVGKLREDLLIRYTLKEMVEQGTSHNHMGPWNSKLLASNILYSN